VNIAMHFYETDSDDDEKKPRNLNKKNCGKPPKRIVDRHRTAGVGKSTLIKNLILHQRPRFEQVFLVHQDATYTTEYDDLDCTEIFDEIPDIDFWELPEGSPYIKRCVILDDLELTSADRERKKRLAILFRYCSTHKGLTVYFAHQSCFDTPSLIRKMADVWILWRPRSIAEMHTIENRVGFKKGDLKQLFDTVATGHRDSICIDLKENSPAKLRKNVWERISAVQSDTEELEYAHTLA